MNIVIAAGGTGGHLFPGLAVGEVLRARGHAVMVLISEKEIDALATRGRSEFRFEKIPGVGLPKLFSPAIFKFLRGFRAGLRQCRALYADFKPDAVLGMGGFTSTGPILAGRRLRVPTFVHESNAIPGKANRLNARMAGGVLVGFEECARHFPGARCITTGTPVRSSLRTRMARVAAAAAFGLDPERKTLLVMGGSQGAQGINRAVLESLPALAGAGLQVVHLAGREGEESARAAYAAAGVPAFVAAFHHRMEEAYSAADICVARSGAASLTELAHFALPGVLIPYPHAAEDHQTHNARIFESAGAALLLPEAGLVGGGLAAHLLALVRSPEKLAAMSERSASLASPDAAEAVADILLEACSGAHAGVGGRGSYAT